MGISLVRRVGRFMSEIMVKNIPLFITVSLFQFMNLKEARELLLDTGIPLILAYTSGNKIEKKYGGLVGVIVLTGVLIKIDFNTLLGPIIVGVISGYTLKQFYLITKKYQRPGYEMLINNIGVLSVGALLYSILHSIYDLYMKTGSHLLDNFGDNLPKEEIVVFLTMIVEPLKVFFLNNVVNHGIFSVLGISEIEETGKSIYFLLETNPGPGFGVLMAYYYYANRKEMLSNAFIVLFGGVHEVYFVHVLKRLYLLIPLIAGSICGVYFNILFNLGLTGVASPGSLIMIMLVAPLGDRMLLALSISLSALVTFFLSSVFIKKNIQIEDIEKLEVEKKTKTEKSYTFDRVPESILVVCDAGMGSSAMGASFLRQKLDKNGLYEIRVNNSSVENIFENKADIIIIHSEIYKRIKEKIKGVEVIIIEDFLSGKTYDALIERILAMKAEKELKKSADNKGFLKKSDIKLGLKRVEKNIALAEVGKNLYESGYVEEDYIKRIEEREKVSTTYLENGIAMPHGSAAGKEDIKKSGIVIHQYPYGIDYGNGKTAYVLVGVAVKGNEHIDFLTKLAEIIDVDEKTEKLCMALSEEEIYEIFDWRN